MNFTLMVQITKLRSLYKCACPMDWMFWNFGPKKATNFSLHFKCRYEILDRPKAIQSAVPTLQGGVIMAVHSDTINVTRFR